MPQQISPGVEYTCLREVLVEDAEGDAGLPSTLPSKPTQMQILLQKQLVDSLRETEADVRRNLEDIDSFWSRKQAQVKEELEKVRTQLLDSDSDRALDEDMFRATGPPSLAWVDGVYFSVACTMVIALNMVALVVEVQIPDWKAPLWVCDQIFLLWYCLELSLKACWFRQHMLLGKCSDVAWNWLDLVIVLSGVLDQWLKPAVLSVAGQQASAFSLFNTSGLRALRLLRCVRFLQVGRGHDWSWVEGNTFQSFIMVVIGLNTLLMALELDCPWDGWAYVEQAFLIIYVFELVVRVKRWGLRFFWHTSDWAWNYLDLFIVGGGIADEWLNPLISFIQTLLGHPHHGQHGARQVLFKLIRIVRLVRVLRLVRLLRAVRPLYMLLMGVLRAMQSIMWVLVLTVIILYAFAILATHLMGRGIIFSGGAVPETIQNNFGSVLDSMFFLFKLMNDDQSVMNDVIDFWPAQVLFVVFMVIGNWAILAILTSVMSEGMLSATQSAKDIERREHRRTVREQAVQQVYYVLDHLGGDESTEGFVDRKKFDQLRHNEELRTQLQDALGISAKVLEELLSNLGYNEAGDLSIRYEDFVEKLHKHGAVVSQRSIFRIEKMMRTTEVNVKQRVDDKLDYMRERLAAAVDAQQCLRPS